MLNLRRREASDYARFGNDIMVFESCRLGLWALLGDSWENLD